MSDVGLSEARKAEVYEIQKKPEIVEHILIWLLCEIFIPYVDVD